MIKGIYRSGNDWAQVDGGKHSNSVPHNEYCVNEYEPPFDTLPTKEEFKNLNAVRAAQE